MLFHAGSASRCQTLPSASPRVRPLGCTLAAFVARRAMLGARTSCSPPLTQLSYGRSTRFQTGGEGGITRRSAPRPSRRRRFAAASLAGLAGSGSNPRSWWLRTRQSRSFHRYPFGASLERWRRGRDSNPRRAFNPYSLSRGALSTTQPPLRTLYSGRSSVVLSYRRSGLLVASGSSPFGPASLRDAVGFDACGISRSNPRRAFNPYSLSRGALMRRASPPVLRTGPAARPRPGAAAPLLSTTQPPLRDLSQIHVKQRTASRPATGR